MMMYSIGVEGDLYGIHERNAACKPLDSCVPVPIDWYGRSANVHGSFGTLVDWERHTKIALPRLDNMQFPK